MAAGSTIISSNARLARLLLQDFEEQQKAQGETAWQTPDVLPINVWCQREWETAVLSQHASVPSILLTPDQELHVWTSIITDSTNGLLRVAATAKQAQQAWALLQAWQVACLKLHFNHNEDSQAFFSWAKTFDQQCHRHQWLSAYQLSDVLADVYIGSKCVPENELLLVGFDEITPQQQKLIASLTAAGCKVSCRQLAGCDSKVTKLVCADTRDEVLTISRWLRAQLEKDPKSRIGIVAPDLAASQGVLQAAMNNVLLPQSQAPEAEMVDALNRPWNISLGQPLTIFPIIQTSLKILSLLSGTITLDAMAALLRSPHLAGAEEEASSRALLDVKLREVGEAIVSLSSVQALANKKTDKHDKPNQWYSPMFSECLTALINCQQRCPSQQSAGQWASWFSDCLTAMGWALGRDLSSEEYQTVEAWRKNLLSFSGLDAVANKFDMDSALVALQRMLASRIFQPQSSLASVQVLGLYEAIGLEFDALWIMDCHDKHWPPSPQPNPFIPIKLQRSHGLPHASVERELAVARTVMLRLCRSARNVMVSYPQTQADEALRPSPLISDFQSIEKQELLLWDQKSWREKVRDAAALEVVTEDEVPALSEGKASGGSQIFKHQALCPFRAFAEQRLGAKPLRKPEIGLDSMKRGSLLHHALELFWLEIKSHAQLLAMNQQQLEDCLNNKIKVAMDAQAKQSPNTLSQRFSEIEARRLLALLKVWLEVEKQRQPFVVKGLEKKLSVNVNGVEVNLLIDRVDELEAGGKIIIDYKTGTVSPKQWFGERPEDPQLPLYSTVEGGDIDAVLFGQVRADGSDFKGVVSSDELIPGLPPKRKGEQADACEHWPNVLTEWKTTIETLAEQFQQGIATVDPLKGSTTCQSSYCELMPLCRIHEQSDEVLEND